MRHKDRATGAGGSRGPGNTGDGDYTLTVGAVRINRRFLLLIHAKGTLQLNDSELPVTVTFADVPTSKCSCYNALTTASDISRDRFCTRKNREALPASWLCETHRCSGRFRASHAIPETRQTLVPIQMYMLKLSKRRSRYMAPKPSREAYDCEVTTVRSVWIVRLLTMD